MGAADYLLSPRRNHRGTETPSEASRILFLVTLGCASVWAWPIADGLVFVWFCLVLFVSTPILSIGWYVLSLLGRSRESRDLTPAISRGD